jgi:hypothetical protein
MKIYARIFGVSSVVLIIGIVSILHAQSAPTPDPNLYPAVANWDCVPFQTFAGKLRVGVVAFHPSGIDRVEFTSSPGMAIPGLSSNSSSSARPTTRVAQSTNNPDTGITEYWTTINASDFPDGPITIQATAYPKTGDLKTLTDLTLFTNSKDSLTVPSVTVSTPDELVDASMKIADGGTIYLAAGNYAMPAIPGANRSNTRWINIAGAPGVTADQVVLSAAPGVTRITIHDSRLKFTNLTIDAGGGYLNGVDFVWFDHSILTTASAPWLPAPKADPGTPLRTHMPGANGNYQLYVTDSVATKTIYGFVNAMFVRNSQVHEISGDALQRSSEILNCQVYNFPGTIVHHADIYQTWGGMDNVILYGVKTWNTSGAQGIFIQPTVPGRALQTMSNCAFVNIDFGPNDRDGKGGPPFSQFMSRLRNIYIDHWNTANQRILFRTDAKGNEVFDAQNFIVRDSTFHQTQDMNNPPPGVKFENCVHGVSARPNWPGLPPQ